VEPTREVEMPTWAWILIVVAAAILVLALLASMMTARRRRAGLQDRFGPEYDRTVERTGRRRGAEAELQERERQRERLNIVPLQPEARDRYAESWRSVQTRFVDDPSGAVGDADRLVTDVMRDRGYPIDDFDRRAADVSVDHPDVVENFRAGHEIYLRSDRGEAETEDLRQGFVHYRALFEELLETREPSAQEAR
jgi:predicted nucleic acid-binding protein